MSEDVVLTREETATLRLDLGLGAEGLVLHMGAGAVPLDQNPYLADLCALKVAHLGHHDVLPRPWDWDNLLSLLEPGEELLWIVDYQRAVALQGRETVDVHLALKFTGDRLTHPTQVVERRRRFRAVASQFSRQAFPESRVETLPPQRTWNLVQRLSSDPGARTVCVAGMPSPRTYADDAIQVERDTSARSWQSLNDVVETCLGLETSFRLVFVVARLAEQELNHEYARITRLRDVLHPLVRQQRQATDSTGRSVSDQVGVTRQKGGSQKEGDLPFAESVRRWLNVGRVAIRRETKGEVKPTHTWGLSEATSRTEGTTETRTEGRTAEELRSDLLMADETLDRYTRSLYDARGTGAFRAAVLITATGASTDVIAGAVRGVLSGARSKDHPLSAFEVVGEAGALLRTTRPTLELLTPALPVLQLDQACHLLLLPEAELPGLPLQRSVFLGRNATPVSGGQGPLVSLGHDAFLDGSSGGGRRDIEMPARDLYRHVLVAGTTGSGKTRRVLKILGELRALGDDLRVIVFETAKRTYREEFQRLPGPAPRIYSLGDATEFPLRLNPFHFEPGTSLKRHVSVLADALSELMPTEAMIGPYLREAVEAAYLHAGWDIETGRPIDGGTARTPSVVEFVHHVRRVGAQLRYGAEVGANYRGALEARARLFLDATFQDIFSGGGERSIEEMFDRDTIIELEALPPSEIDLPAFLLSLLLERLRAHQTLAMQRGSPRGWLLVVEEAHNVLSRDGEGRRDSGESNSSRTLLTRVVRLLQEGRELRIGVMVVDQAPAMLARGVLKNTNTKIAMRLEDNEEIAEMGQALALDEDRWRDLGLLRQGEAIVKATYMAQPVKSGPYRLDELPPKVDPARRDPVAGSAPAYAVLETEWARVLTGQGPAPDASWMARLIDAAVSDGEIFRFGLGRALLRHWQPGSRAEARAAELLDVFGALPVERGDLLTLARRLHARARSEELALALGPLEQRVFAAEAEGAWNARWAPPSTGAVQVAAEVLGRGPRGARFERWHEALLDLTLARERDWPDTAARFRAVRAALQVGPFHTTVRLRCFAARLADHALVEVTAAQPRDPVAEQVLSRDLVEEVACDGPKSPDLRLISRQVAEILRRVQEVAHGE